MPKGSGVRSSPYADTVLVDTPHLYWRLGEATGTTAADFSGNGRTGTYGAGVTLAQASILVGDPDSSAGFSDVANSIVSGVAGSSGDFSGNQAFAIELWFRATTLDTTARRLYQKAANAAQPNDGFSIQIKSSNTAFVR